MLRRSFCLLNSRVTKLSPHICRRFGAPYGWKSHKSGFYEPNDTTVSTTIDSAAAFAAIERDRLRRLGSWGEQMREAEGGSGADNDGTTCNQGAGAMPQLAGQRIRELGPFSISRYTDVDVAALSAAVAQQRPSLTGAQVDAAVRQLTGGCSVDGSVSSSSSLQLSSLAAVAAVQAAEGRLLELESRKRLSDQHLQGIQRQIAEDTAAAKALILNMPVAEPAQSAAVVSQDQM